MFQATKRATKLFGISESIATPVAKTDIATVDSYKSWYAVNGTKANINENSTALRIYCNINESLGDRGYFRLGIQLGMWNRNTIPAAGKPYVKDLVQFQGK